MKQEDSARPDSTSLEIDNLYRNFLDASAAMMWVSDVNGRVKFFNQSWLAFTGRSLEDEIGHEWTGDEIYPDDADACFTVYQEGFKSRRPFEHEYRLLRYDGEYRWVHENIIPYVDGNNKIAGFVGTCIDVTDRKEAILLANKELKKKNVDLEQFAYVASHDLQEPLRKIQSFSQLLISRFAEELPGQAQDYLNRMERAATRMRTLVTDLLTFSRVSTRSKPFTEIDLEKEILDVISDLEIRIKETGGEIKTNGLPRLQGDPSQIRQLLLNIIGNGLKFHRPEIPPVININSRIFNKRDSGLSYRDINMLELIITDNGIGFDNKYAERIFEPFQRLHGVNEYDGSGIGLAICKKIVDRHQGKLSARSTPGEGTSFIIELPLQQESGGVENGQG